MQITLAGKTFEVDPLTLRQLRDLAVGSVGGNFEGDPETMVADSYDRPLKAIAVALKAKNPDMTAEAMLDQPITRKELTDAYQAVMLFSGLVQPKQTLSQLREQLGALQAQIAEAEELEATGDKRAGEEQAGAA